MDRWLVLLGIWVCQMTIANSWRVVKRNNDDIIHLKFGAPQLNLRLDQQTPLPSFDDQATDQEANNIDTSVFQQDKHESSSTDIPKDGINEAPKDSILDESDKFIKLDENCSKPTNNDPSNNVPDVENPKLPDKGLNYPMYPPSVINYLFPTFYPPNKHYPFSNYILPDYPQRLHELPGPLFPNPYYIPPNFNYLIPSTPPNNLSPYTNKDLEFLQPYWQDKVPIEYLYAYASNSHYKFPDIYENVPSVQPKPPQYDLPYLYTSPPYKIPKTFDTNWMTMPTIMDPYGHNTKSGYYPRIRISGSFRKKNKDPVNDYENL